MYKGSTTSKAEIIPFFAQLWRKTYHSVPQVCFPFTNLNISFSLVSATFLICVRILAIRFLENVFGWPEDASDEGAASFAAIAHSSILIPGLVTAFLSHKYSPSEHISAAPQWWQELVDAMLQFCTGYMIYDGTFIMVTRLDLAVSWIPALIPADFLFLGHHLATAIYMTQARVYRAGHMSAMMCMLLGEASNPLHNSFMIAKKAVTLACCNGAFSQLIYACLKVVFSFVYILLRVVLGPFIFTHMSWDLLFSKNAREHLPLPLRIFWNFMIWAVVVGSYSWIVFCYGMLNTYFNGAPEQEL
jgi:hypothetical protein